MKLRIRDRLLSALMGLVLIACAACILLWFAGVLPLERLLSELTEGWLRWTAIGVCALLMIIGLSGIGVLFRRRKDKGVVVQHTEYGDMSISMKAMENMVKKCVDAHPELNVNHTHICHSRGGISVDIKITLLNGVNIPLTVNALQKQIKQYITSCSGVDVEEVRVMVETEAAKSLPAPEVEIVPIEQEQEPVLVEKAAECICQHQEEPAAYAAAATVTIEDEAAPAETASEEKPETALDAEREEAQTEEDAAEEPAEETAEEITVEAEA